jgi:hypothetical protein
VKNWERTSARELNVSEFLQYIEIIVFLSRSIAAVHMERWNVGILEYCESKAEKALLLVQERFAKRESKRFLASGLKSCAAGRSSNLYPSNTPHHSSIPFFQYSSWVETPEFDFSRILSSDEPPSQRSRSEE